jgi:hypothetical protein
MVLGAGGPPRQHQVAHHRGRIADPDLDLDLDLVRDNRAELGEHRARLVDRPRPVRFELVPVRWQPEHRPRIAGAQRADDQVVHLLGVLQHDQPGVVVEADAQFLAGGAAIGEQALPEGGIDPGACDHPGAQRGGARIDHIDLVADFLRPDQLLLDQKLADRPLHDVVVTQAGGRADFRVRMIVTAVCRSHRQILSSHVS